MNLFFKILIIVSIVFLISCQKKEKVTIIVEEDIELQMIEAYKEGLKSLNEGEVLYAAKKFNESELLYPQSDWAPKSALMAAYAYYSQDYYGDAIYELKRFIKTYPNDSRMSYAYFLISLVLADILFCSLH